MGSIISSHMDAVMQKNIDNMMAQQRVMLERNIQMQNYMRERQMAMQIAGQREMFYNWWAPFYGIAAFACIAGFMKSKHPGPLVPLLPLTFVFGYQADMAMGNKMDRIRGDAGRILSDEMGVLSLPGPGLPTVDVLDERRDAMRK